MTAKSIQKLLAAKHSKDVFVSECKTGPTWYGAPMRLDGYALKRSWAQPATYGYEIKVSRSDFLGDDKWPSYLCYCNYFYFVTPPGLINESEVPEGVGWICASKNCAKLYTKRKAPRRDINDDDLVDILRYMLISRARMDNQNIIDRNGCPIETISSRDRWRRWLQQKRADRDLGHEVSRRIRDKVAAVERENRELRRRIERADEVEKSLVEAGFTLSDIAGFRLKDSLSAALGGVAPKLIQPLRELRSNADRILQRIDTTHHPIRNAKGSE